MKKSDRFKLKNRDDFSSAVCPGGEGAVLKTVGCNGLHVRIVCTALRKE